MSSTKSILILSASPRDKVRLRLDEEVREIEEGLRRSKHREQFAIHSKWAIRLRDFRRAMLDYEPQIVHFCGHGENDGIMVENEQGNATSISLEALSGLFELFADHVKCVLLNACYSQNQAEVIHKHVNYVIGMKESIGDRAAIEFAVGFYDALGAGKSFEKAFKFACNAIQLYDNAEHLIPILRKNITNDNGEDEEITALEKKLKLSTLSESLQNKEDTLSLTFDNIFITQLAQNDCKALEIPLNEPAKFVLNEALNHPTIFSSNCNSVPLVFFKYILLLSWDGGTATIERILSRGEAYPLNDAWSSCLALYRRATLLPYRNNSPEKLTFSTEAKRTINHYKKLTISIKGYLSLFESTQKDEGFPNIIEFEPLIDDAEFALENNDIGTAIGRMEILLSTVHKLLIQYAPQTSPKSGTIRKLLKKPSFKPLKVGVPSLLIVDDVRGWRELLVEIWQDEGFQVHVAQSTVEAMQAMVDNSYDIVITDMRLVDESTENQDGREVAIAAKTSNPKTKIIILTGYPGMTRNAEILPYDLFLEKAPDGRPLDIDNFTKSIKKLLIENGA